MKTVIGTVSDGAGNYFGCHQGWQKRVQQHQKTVCYNAHPDESFSQIVKTWCINHELPLMQDDWDDEKIKEGVLQEVYDFVQDVRSFWSQLAYSAPLIAICARENKKVRKIGRDIEQRWLRHLLHGLEIMKDMYKYWILCLLKKCEDGCVV